MGQAHIVPLFDDICGMKKAPRYLALRVSCTNFARFWSGLWRQPAAVAAPFSRGLPTTMRSKMTLFLPATLGLLTAFGPFVTDFYLPVLPEMAEYFHTSPALVSMSLTTGMFGLAAGQVFIGPLTDKYGRRHILLGSMLLFAVASALCIWSTNIFMFNVCRLFQGIAGAGGIVISKSMATDLYSGHDLARFMAILGAINGIAPVSAPVVGGLVSAVTSWQGIFGVLMAIGLVLLVCCAILRETLSPEMRIYKNILGIYANLFRVFRNPTFTLSALGEMLCHFTLFGYISASPFILQQVYGLSPLRFSLCFAINALAIGVGSVLGARFRRTSASLRFGAIFMLVATLCLGMGLNLHLSLLVVMPFYVCTLAGFGLLQPGLTSTALDSERHNAGAASAIYGASAFLAGALVSPVVTMGRIELTSSVVMTLGAVVCLLLSLALARRLTACGN